MPLPGRSRFCAALLATALHGLALAQGDLANRAASDGRSGTLVLRFDDDLCRAYCFCTADHGLVQGTFGIHRQRSQLLALTKRKGDLFCVGWQDGEVARMLDYGELPPSVPFDRINANEVAQRFQGPTPVPPQLAVHTGHVYAIVIDNPIHAERLVLPGDPLLVKLQVLQHDAGKSVTLRWAILNEPLAVVSPADGTFDPRLLPRLPRTDDTGSNEQARIDTLLAKVASGDEDAVDKLLPFRHKVLPLAVDFLCTLDRRSQDDSDSAWRIDCMLNALTGGGPQTFRSRPARSRLEEHTAMVRRWYAAARRWRTAEQWDAVLPPPAPPRRR